MFNDPVLLRHLRDWVQHAGDVDETHPFYNDVDLYIHAMPHQTHFIERLMGLLSFIKAKKHKQKGKTTAQTMKVRTFWRIGFNTFHSL